ncbi:putative NADH dehydrogenase [ubiquinone] 1 alpha subcomplex subunit 11 [Plasmopara halstedii]
MSGHAGSEKIMFTTATGAFFGITVGSVESVWAIPKLGAKLPKLSKQLKHVGQRSLVFAAVGCIFTTGEYVASQIRQKEDPINAGVGGALVGIVPGMVKQSVRVGVGAGIASAAIVTAASFWQSSQETSFEKYAAARHAERA